jgi:F-type H+-transporting ATPase subunit b
VALLAAEQAPQAKNPILPQPNEIIWGLLAFLVLLGVMWKFAFPAVTKMMNDRTERIRSNLDSAEKVKAEAQEILEDYQRQLADAKNEANRIIEEARQTAEGLRRDLMQRAEAEVAELRQRSAEDIAAAQERALADLRSRIATLVIAAAEKVVERNLDRDTNAALIENFINSVGATN